MGEIYDGPYAEQVGYNHEGSAGQVLADGSMARGRTADAVANVACCGCGWRGKVRWPAGDEGEAEALAEWDRHHLQPLIAGAAAGWGGWARQVAGRAQAVADHVEAGRPDRAVLVLARLSEAVEAYVRIAGALVQQKAQADLAQIRGDDTEGAS